MSLVLFPLVLAVREGGADPSVHFSVAVKPSAISKQAEIFFFTFSHEEAV